MTKDLKKDVFEIYNEIVDWYDENRFKGLMEKEYLELVIDSIPANGKILDLGCGTGEPLARFFIEKGYQLTGVDGSENMIKLCQKRFPRGRWIICDMRKLMMNEKFDAIWAWDSSFHLPKEDQASMFPIYQSHIKNGGILIFTSGPDNGEVWSEMNGLNFYHSSLSPLEYLDLIHQHNFKVLVHNVADPKCGEHTVWVCRSSH